MQTQLLLGSLLDWTEFPKGAKIPFALEDGQEYRRVRADLTASRSRLCEVWMDDENGVSKRYMSFQVPNAGGVRLQFSARGNAEIRHIGEIGYTDSANDRCFVRLNDESQVVPASDDPPYVSLQPGSNPATEEVRRMMHLMRLNSEARERALQTQLEELRKRLDAKP